MTALHRRCVVDEYEQIRAELARVAEKLAACIAWKNAARYEPERKEAQSHIDWWKSEEQRWLRKLATVEVPAG